MWDKVIFLFWFIVGTIFGSFSNVLIYRPIAGLKLTEPRFSVCPNCKKRIKWYDNIPLVSFIVLRGRCRYCKSKISVGYPLIELLFGVVFLINYMLFPIDIALCLDLVFLVSVPAIFTDFKLMLLPDYTWITILVVSSYLNIVHFYKFLGVDVIGALISLGVLLFLRIRYKDGIGEGDVFLLPVFSFAVGFFFMPFLMLCASVGGIIYSVIRKSRIIPFGPFIIFFGYGLFFLRMLLSF